MVDTFAIASSKFEAVAMLAVPSAAAAALSGLSLLPAAVVFSPIFSVTSPIFSSDILLCFAAASKSFKRCSVLAISLCNPLYCSSLTSPRSNCCCTCFSASFKVSNFSFVLPIASFNIFCFWANSSVFVGSSLSSLSTSRNSFCKELHELLTPESALDSLVVSPPISIVIPLILPATYYAPFWFLIFSRIFLRSGLVCVIL